MSKSDPPAPEPIDQILARQDARDLLISHLYDIAVDPTSYVELRDWWDSVIRPAWPEGRAVALADLDSGTKAHLRRAATLLDQAENRSNQEPVAALLDLFRSRAAFVLDASLVIRAATPAATTLLGLTVGSELPGSVGHGHGTQDLRSVLKSRLRADAAATGVFRLEGAGIDRPMVVFLRPQTLPDTTTGLLVVIADFVWQPGAVATLRAAFDLTEAEADVARLVAEGRPAKEIARRRGASPETVRKQVQAVFRKTNTRSQVELSRAVLSVADIAVYTEARTRAEAPPATPHLPLVPVSRVTGCDGRGLEYLVLGDRTGRPVLHLSQDYGFVRLPAPAEAEAARLGLRLITPIYAGYGGSDPLPRGADYASATVADLLSVLDAEGVTRAPILASMMTYHAVHLITAAPERFSALVQVPATFPLETRAQFERMDKWHRFINGAARFTPGVLPFFVKAGFHLARRLGKHDFLHAVYGDCPGDMATLADQAALEALVAGSEVALGPGVDAHGPFARQVIARAAEPWADRLRALEGRLPVYALQGRDDPYCPPDTLAEMRAAYPWVQIEEIENAGELLLFSHWRRALALIAPYA